ncbi:DENN domain and WD repeat-containing protein SCD1 [Senna tora]|uniref:DENN domain and WD repeat-containing protein SCD1 n=1 Tax=Senna tora TaxID=362788 RepID=A0A834WXW4_9FABA|nr:DENN domain and WD repeat-containing protein SCD1 [Senna tora]
MNAVVREFLSNKKLEEIPTVVESLLSKVVEECERCVLIQHEMVYACFFFIMFSFIINDTFTQVFCSDEHSNNMLDKLHATRCNWKGPISDSDVGRSGSGAQYIYDRFPSNIRTEKQQEEKRKQILAAASSAFEYSRRHTLRHDLIVVGLFSFKGLSLVIVVGLFCFLAFCS